MISDGGREGWVPKDKLKKSTHKLSMFKNNSGTSGDSGVSAPVDSGASGSGGIGSVEEEDGSDLWDLREHHYQSVDVFHSLNGEPKGIAT